MRFILFLMLMMVANVANAIDCQKLPSCTELGYSKEDVKGCAENGYLNCPFDETYKKCVNYDCEALGFTESDKSSWCADLIKCKGNDKMTLCQNPCVATNAQELKDLASSGKCKVVTMRNDITIPENQDITLAENTTLDGSGHTITATYTLFTLLDGAKLKNLHINRKIASAHSATLILVQANGFFEDLSVSDENNNTAGNQFGRGICGISGTLTLSGALKFEAKNDIRHVAFYGFSQDAKLIIENAKLEVITPKISANAFSKINHIVARNSEINIKTGSTAFAGENNEELELINSKVIVESFYAFCWATSGYTFKIGADSYLDIKSNTPLLSGVGRMKIIFNGETEKPATAIISQTSSNAEVDVQNLGAKLVLGNKTYKPTKTGITPLSEVQSSQNWTLVQ